MHRRGRLATFDADDHAFVAEVGDVVVKPTRGEQGKGITVGADGPEELDVALARAREQHPEVPIEQRAPGDDLRLVVINRWWYTRCAGPPRWSAPASTPSGNRSRPRAAARPRPAAVADPDGRRHRSRRTVREAGWALDDVLPDGVRLRVRRTANLHQGGTIHDVTAEVNPELRRVAVPPPRPSASR